ncbi:MAG: TonB-dependent receptor [Bacteroidia bacterium]|nr:TonB-dependent receptor [Bacteroidia bacterium]
MQLQLDKRVFNIGQDLSNIGANAADILDNVPSVAVDIDGNVSLRGSQNVRILINGKPSGLVGISSNDALRQLQGSMIESIEVITNPSARYDAEGEVGIINIILKKNTTQGVNGTFTVNTGYPANYGASFNLNFRNNKTNLFANYGFNYRSNPGKGSSFQDFASADTTFRYEQTSDRTRSDKSHNLMVGMDYFLNDYNTITGSVVYRSSAGLNKSTYEYLDIDEFGSVIETVTRTDREREPEDNVELALNYRKEFKDKKDRLLTFDFKYMNNDETERSDFRQHTMSIDSVGIQRSSNTEDEQNILFQSDYVHPFGADNKGKFEAGIKSTNRIIDNNFLVEQLNADSEWQTVSNFDNNLVYTERIHAAYLIVGKEFAKFSAQGGVRGEYSDIKTELTRSNEVNHRTYFNIFPSVHLAYKITQDKTIQLSYSYRLSRPGFRELIPFSNFSDSRVLFTGNPNLNPEYTHSTEAGYLLNWENGSLLSSAYYRYRTGVFQRITEVDEETGITKIFPINLATENAYGLEFNLNYTVGGWCV